jgi:hypothetical protein
VLPRSRVGRKAREYCDAPRHASALAVPPDVRGGRDPRRSARGARAHLPGRTPELVSEGQMSEPCQRR